MCGCPCVRLSQGSRLFASPAQPTLRRMCYLTIKEMSCIAEDVIIVTSRRVLGS